MIDCNCIMNVAMLRDNEVMNIVVSEDLNLVLQQAIELYGIDHGDARDTFGWNVGIGDFFKDFQWFHADGTMCDKVPTGEERIGELEYKNIVHESVLEYLIAPRDRYMPGDGIVEFYYNLVKNNRITIDEVPIDRNIRNSVSEYMDL